MSGSPPRTWGRRRLQSRPLPRPAVHPHARGEDPHGVRPERQAERFTPTHVGKTPSPRRSGTSCSAVHPHARGEDLTVASDGNSVRGSPPRTWGRRTKGPCLTAPMRFTPTHVGKTDPAGAGEVGLTVHPHARGEDRAGSSWPCGARRFTPTHVGKTPDTGVVATVYVVHPHARGEDGLPRAAGWSCCGSPPRTWGRLSDGGEVTTLDRFTPTHVGKTPSPATPGQAVRVHPHARGEDEPLQLLRGDGGRFTPTHVGKTSPPGPVPPAGAVHPHARGEDFNSDLSERWLTGSPPRTWGRRNGLPKG